MSEHYAVRLGKAGMTVSAIHSLLIFCWAVLLHVILTQIIYHYTQEAILHSHSPFDRHHFLLSQPTIIGNCTFSFDMCLEFLSLHLNCKAGRIRASLNALCDVLAENTQALWDDTCHPPSLQSCPHFTLTDEGWCCLITQDSCQGGRGETRGDICMRVNQEG